MNDNHPVWGPLNTPIGRPGVPALIAPDGHVGSARPSLFVEHTAMWVVHRPWLAVVAIAAVAVSVAARLGVAGWRHRHHADHAQLITIAPPPEVEPAGAGAMWANLSGTLSPSWRRRLLYGTPQCKWFGFEIVTTVPGIPASAATIRRYT